ncbi:MAG: hypothetical protein J07HB67_02176 [halophilic archaeon J07HB67]|nr:MAG: hypothetical protein J07HB67_02176 [halophilic archaeon J07HB67]
MGQTYAQSKYVRSRVANSPASETGANSGESSTAALSPKQETMFTASGNGSAARPVTSFTSKNPRSKASHSSSSSLRVTTP